MPSLTTLWAQLALTSKKWLTLVTALGTMRLAPRRPSSPQESIRSRSMPRNSVRRLRQQLQPKLRDWSERRRPRPKQTLRLRLRLWRPSKPKKRRISDSPMKRQQQLRLLKHRQTRLQLIKLPSRRQRPTGLLQRRKLRLIKLKQQSKKRRPTKLLRRKRPKTIEKPRMQKPPESQRRKDKPRYKLSRKKKSAEHESSENLRKLKGGKRKPRRQRKIASQPN